MTERLADLLHGSESCSFIFAGGEPSRAPLELDNTYVPNDPGFEARHFDFRFVPPLKLNALTNAVVGGLAYVEHNGQLLTGPEFMPEHIRVASSSPQAKTPGNLALDTIEVVDIAILFVLKGFDVYGHWLLDILPRLYAAKMVLGHYWSQLKIILPSDVPSFAIKIMCDHFGVDAGAFLFYVRWETKLRVRRLIIPDLIHNNYFFHPLAEFLYSSMALKTSETSSGDQADNFYVSRRKYSSITTSVKRFLLDEDAVVKRAEKHGILVLSPEDMNWSQQVTLFSRARFVVGEAGSALHNAVFSMRPSRLLSIRPLNMVQSRIAAVRGTHVNYLAPKVESKIGDSISFSIDIDRFDSYRRS